MKNVRVLPPEIISKIAAGEVIDRPVSVIKELIENSIDAGADSIEIHVTQAGKSSIRIKDNGGGIAEEDMETVFERHATSKISKVDDLFDVHSLGFRGEALYSVAAVSDITLQSRVKDSASGWEIHLRGGKKLGLKPSSFPEGTEIEIKELFFNTPARRKFLKSNTSEMNQIVSTVIPYALLHPDIRFLLKHQNRTSLDLEPQDSALERVAQTLNLDKDHLQEVTQEFSDRNLKIRAILGDINIIRSRRDLQFIFINGRPVQSKNISYNVNEVYRLLLPPGNHPFFALFLDLPGEFIDVNIHPTKREVKIKDEYKISAVIRSVCERALMNAGGMKKAMNFDDKQETSEQSSIRKGLTSTYRSDTKFETDEPASSFEFSGQIDKKRPTEQYSFPQSDDIFAFDDRLFEENYDTLQNKFANARYIGAFRNKILLFESGKSLLLVDQHAAQERIVFEQLVRQMDESRVEVQHLLSPYTIPLSPQDFLAWEEAQKQLEDMGFSSTQFDKETIAVHTHPALIKDADKAVREILAGGNPGRCDHETLARRACRASVMAGDKLDARQAEFQREQLLKCKDPFTCPHGRPTVIEMTENYLDKQFLRS